MLSQPYDKLYADLASFIPRTRLIHDPLRTLAYGTDASFYRLVPQLVVKVESEREVARVLQLARAHGTPVTFRAAGTSVSGQAISDSVLLMLGDGWRQCEVQANGAQVRLQPGVIGGQANRALARYQRKIGPDPASINICTIGGIAANNSTGMCCVTSQDSYHTMVNARLIFSDGAVLDTGDAASRRAFAESHRSLVGALDALARRTRANAALAERIRKKFQIRNTCGYSLHALIDFEDPIDILQHLMIGSEGTLGFIAEMTYRTVADPPHKASALLLFPDVRRACEAASRVRQAPVAAVELMDRAALRSVEAKPGMPAYLKELPAESAALLIETRAPDRGSLGKQVEAITGALSPVPAIRPLQFTDDPAEYTPYWNMRKGLYPSVGAMRAAGTTVVTEDVVFPLPELAAATTDLQKLLARHAYHEAIILGHALEGNLHIIFTPDFGRSHEIDRYRRFMDDYARMVVDQYDGSLKGEHGTGRNMAPFVAREWGAQAYALMHEIKSLLDPDHILNPGVILNSDSQAHLKNLKPLTAVDPAIDKCIECGFCELTCPSNATTLTPRQRIVVLRELARLEPSAEDPARARALRAAYRYQGIETCAGDGLCALACPVEIDTGQMMRLLRTRALGGGRKKAASWLASHFSAAAHIARALLATLNGAHALLGTSVMQASARAARALSRDTLPRWNPYVPTPARLPLLSKRVDSDRPSLVYFPGCASRIMGPARGDPQSDALPLKVDALLRTAGYAVVYPDGLSDHCCGLMFESYGAAAPAEGKLRALGEALRRASDNGRHAIVCDTSPCSLRLKQGLSSTLTIFDIVEFIHDFVLDRVPLRPASETVALHATCSARRLGLEGKLARIADACAAKVIVPEEIGCCGFAGAKGFTTPELSASALRHLRESLPPDCVNGYSTSRTCEIGLSLHSGRYYRSIVYLVANCARL